MQITVNVQLAKGEAADWTLTLDEMADAVLKALGGDEDVDHCTVAMQIPEPGSAGTPPGPPVPFMVQQGTQLPPEPTQSEPPVEKPPSGQGGGKPKEAGDGE